MGCRCLLSQVVNVLAARVSEGGLPREQTIQGVTTDSRVVPPGSLFVALRGDRFDGHAFVRTALEQGAIAAVVSEPVPGIEDLPVLQVPDTLVAYQTLGRWWREQFPGPVIAVTGSVGKTTTKEMIAAVLGTCGSVLKTQANFNNEIGVPKTLLELDPEVHQFAVVEMGMRASGEIALLTQIARPDIAVITNVGTAHIGRLGSEQAIAQAKCELLEQLPETGIAVLNHDNARLISTAAKVWSGKTLTYGLEGGDIQGHLLNAQTLQVEGLTFPLPLPGRHNALNFLAGLTVARIVGIDWEPLTQGITVELPKGRAQRYSLPGDVVILDETYNAGVESMLAALHLLAETPGQRRIAVLGTMKELGERSPELHHRVGAAVRQLKLDRLLVLADPAEQEALMSGAAPVPAEAFESHETLAQRLSALVQPGDRLLFKASRSMELDKVVSQVVARLGDAPA
ncbi:MULTISPECIES: UDP-N-acetylmuramoyl-tripeptide--D-alanyl-D-alanine ligase [unclassified Leptolyngbya]|uniref:UDP-N-acetylmuramoyl-tripeptide--D-alanyl-D- alanine ligase n=1 Tax=unclassified Leptolyngbya TaxID=2650499 RepID=UPI00168289CB|nr:MULTISPECIES: UDP-N-acetylmuramoyl-tripeptide--D-alanyl-D-alanine ligase [unclassified Leptolyngbya]MBD1911599.1 UDP-N-acetylmuramoyl-tripeptide--D-alanyl-D-alanine ligase [Leptolyngbya sp. FACHB-8]MBD2158768.1 UDP-N-acetylmuramoyl-tripeptide--D-alanyl-D-alanine ligase [Leptolyngbya sp. FACHB-16]